MTIVVATSAWDAWLAAVVAGEERADVQGRAYVEPAAPWDEGSFTYEELGLTFDVDERLALGAGAVLTADSRVQGNLRKMGFTEVPAGDEAFAGAVYVEVVEHAAALRVEGQLGVEADGTPYYDTAGADPGELAPLSYVAGPHYLMIGEPAA